LKDDSKSVAWQGTQSFDIPGGRTLTVVPQEFQDNRISLKVRLTQGDKPVVDTTVKIANKGNFILGGPPHERRHFGAVNFRCGAVAACIAFTSCRSVPHSTPFRLSQAIALAISPSLAIEIQLHQCHRGRHGGAADIEDNVELLR
jgi:hypothetical protein